MNPWLAIAGVVVWTAGVAYYANEHGYRVAEKACQEERDRAQEQKRKLEAGHAEAGKLFEEERKDDEEQITHLELELARVARDKPVACRLGPERLRIWNQANAGTPLPGEPAGEVRRDVPAAGDR